MFFKIYQNAIMDLSHELKSHLKYLVKYLVKDLENRNIINCVLNIQVFLDSYIKDMDKYSSMIRMRGTIIEFESIQSFNQIIYSF